MSREDTNKIKREVMNKIAKSIPNAKVSDKKWITAPHHLIRVFASRDYDNNTINGRVDHNWFGLSTDDLKDEPNKILIFTTGSPKKVLIIPTAEFQKNILPYLREAQAGYFFLIEWKNNHCVLPQNYVPKSLRNQVSDDGLPLDKYVNNFTALGTSYEIYLKHFDFEPPTSVIVENQDLSLMIKTIADKDPTFLTKSTEEKLIIIRYHQLKNN